MELLVVTITQANPTREAEALTRMRLISDTVRNAPGLLNARFYRSQGPENVYFLLTTWENTEWWQKAQERHSPRKLLLESAPGIFPVPPDQWLMQYLWGYSRPLAQPVIATAHMAMVRLEYAERVQQSWLESLQKQASEPILSFALLARSIENESSIETRPLANRGQPASIEGAGRRPAGQGPMFFNLLSWPGETYREDFYSNESYRSMQGLLNSAGVVRIVRLELM
jgi:quinol monooxygenase YgiN